MTAKSWHLDRRTFLCGAGVTLGLPWLEASAAADVTKKLPKRFCAVYFPFGVSLPKHDAEEGKWNWFPQGEGHDFQFTNTLQSLEPLRENVSVLGGLSHPAGWKMGGHDTGDTFLTAASLTGPTFKNSISLDQLIAAHVASETRYPSLTLSSDGGVGEPTRSTTLSFSNKGRPIPALAKPAQIFARLFGDGDGAIAEQERLLKNSGSMLDLVLEHSKSLNRRLGKQDQRKFQEYLESVRSIEKRVTRAQAWLEIPKPEVSDNAVNQQASPKGPHDYLKAMYDLMYLAFQTDSTRVATYMIGQVAGATTIANAFPASIGLNGNWHGLAHGAGKKGGVEKLGRFDQFLAQHFSYFLTRLKETPEGEGNMLDNTILLYGSSNSRTHNNHNYPLLLAGGNNLGMQHGQYLKFTEKTPLSNLYSTILHRLEIPVQKFADSTGEMTEVLKA